MTQLEQGGIYRVYVTDYPTNKFYLKMFVFTDRAEAEAFFDKMCEEYIPEAVHFSIGG